MMSQSTEIMILPNICHYLKIKNRNAYTFPMAFYWIKFISSH